MEEERADLIMWVLYTNNSNVEKAEDSNNLDKLKRNMSEFGNKVIDIEKRFNRTNDALDEMTTWPKVNSTSIDWLLLRDVLVSCVLMPFPSQFASVVSDLPQSSGQIQHRPLTCVRQSLKV